MKQAIFTFIGLLVVTVIIGMLMVWPLVWLWNFVMPDIFGLPEITYWQMFALYFLIECLFKLRLTVNNKN